MEAVHRVLRQAVLVLVSVATISACGLWSDKSSGTEIEFSNGTFAETMVEAQITSLFAEIYESVAPALVAEQGVTRTLFAPNNAAIEKYLAEAAETIAGVIAKPEVAKALVLAHMLDGSNLSVVREANSTLLVSRSGKRSTLIAIDIASKDGLVHIVDAVLN